MTEHQMKVITVANLKGGSGKTSAAVPLGYWSAQAGLSSAVIDLDTSESASQWIQSAHLASTMLGTYKVSIERLQATLDELEDAVFDRVFVDTPSFNEAVVIRAMGVSDAVLIPVRIGTGDLGQLPRTLDLLDLPRRANADLKVFLLPNHTGTMKAVERDTMNVLEGLREQYNFTVLPGVPLRSQYATAKGSVPTGEHYQQLLGLIMESL